MPRKPFDLENFMSEFIATEKDVAEGKAKSCTKHNCPCGNVPLLLDAFYNDKSNRTGKAPWCKAAEASYNKKYTQGLKETGTRKKGEMDEEALVTFESIMQSERKPRKVQVQVEIKTETPVAKSKPEKVVAKKSSPRKRAPRKVAEEEVIPL